MPEPSGNILFPVARWRRRALLNGETTDLEMPDMVYDTSDDEVPAPRPPGSSGDGAERSVPLPANLVVPGTDTRGLGGEDHGGQSVRKYKGSTRPPMIPPQIWQQTSKKEKAIAIREYQAELEAARTGAAAPAVGAERCDAEDIPRMPLAPSWRGGPGTSPREEQSTSALLHRALVDQERNVNRPQG